VKLEAILIHGPVLDEDGNRICKVEELDFDHQPPLMLRVWNPDANDTEPPANDPQYLVPMARVAHRKKTAKKDVPEIAKTKRLAADHEDFRRKILSRECGEKRKPSGRIKSRGFTKRKSV
jgi:hypothetical protein